MGVRHCLLLAGGIGSQWDARPWMWDIACYWLVVLGVSGMRDHGCETLPVIGWWYWESVGCETMGVRHCLLLAGGIGSQWDARPWMWDIACYWLVVLGVSGMRDHGCETLPVIGWWYWESVGCEIMGVRHCLLLAGGIGSQWDARPWVWDIACYWLVVLGVSGMRDHGCETLPVIGWWYWESVGCETMGVRHCLLLAGGIGSQWDARPWVWDIACYWLVVLGVSGMRDHGCETLPVIGWWYWESVGCETMGVRHCLLLAGGIGSQWDARPWVWDIACYWLVVLGVSGMRDHGCETLPVIGWWYWESVGCETMGVRHCLLLAGGIGSQWDARPWVWDIACYWLVVLGVSGMRDHGCETLPVIGWHHLSRWSGLNIGSIAWIRDALWVHTTGENFPWFVNPTDNPFAHS